MRAVEIRLATSDLSEQMATMRMWLDEHRFETSSFACRDSETGVLLCLEFKITRHAKEFAERFGGRTDRPMAADREGNATGEILETGLSPYGLVS